MPLRSGVARTPIPASTAALIPRRFNSSLPSSSGPTQGSKNTNGNHDHPFPPQRRSSFLSRHPKKVGVAALGLVGSVAYFSTKAQSASTPSQPPAEYSTAFDADAWVASHPAIRSEADFKNQDGIILYQYETCPFCNKVRAYLDYEKIKYQVVEVNPMTKAEKKVTPELASIKAVPVLAMDGHKTLLSDSTHIIRNLNNILNHYRPEAQRKTITEKEQADLAFVDQRVVILTAPNLYRTWGESLESFDYLAKNSQIAANSSKLNQWFTKYFGASVMYLLTQKKLNKKYGITDARESIYQAIKEWLAGNNGAPFRGGSSPNLADLSCFGVFRALEPYPVGRDVMNPEKTSEEFVAWYKRMQQVVGKTSATNI